MYDMLEYRMNIRWFLYHLIDDYLSPSHLSSHLRGGLIRWGDVPDKDVGDM